MTKYDLCTRLRLLNYAGFLSHSLSHSYLYLKFCSRFLLFLEGRKTAGRKPVVALSILTNSLEEPQGQREDRQTWRLLVKGGAEKMLV